MESIERYWLRQVLEHHANNMGEKICDDVVLQDTPENRAFIERLNIWNKIANPDNTPFATWDDGICVVHEYMITDYLISLLPKS